VVCDERATLVWLAQLAALELHPSLSLARNMDVPTALVFDLDPGPPATIRECCVVGLLVRDLFESIGLESFAKTSGSKGLQVYVPLNGRTKYDTTKPFAQAVAQALERARPELVVSRMTKKLRVGKVLVDWSQNTRSKTTVAVYSLRARERPTVSTPVTWDEVRAGADGDDELRFEAADVLERIAEHGDLFAPVLELKQTLPRGRRPE
jgi:bifunctional non-homologous end joining protein LigD